jgi:hypothetical protein
MRKLIMAGLAFVLLSLGCTVAQAQSTQHFVISASASGYNGQKGEQAVSLAGAAVQVTNNVSVGYFNISNPTDSTQPKYHMGVVNYTRELQALVGKKLASKVVFDTTNWLVTFQAGAGKVSYLNAQHVAEVGGVFLSRPIANNMQIQCGYQVLHGVGTSVLTRNVTQQPSVGIVFTF